MKLKVLKLGLIEYNKALDLQVKIQKLVQQEKMQHTLLLLEHYPVITMGIKVKNNNNILVSEDFLNTKGIQIYKTDRGGDVTYHGPGQIVGYPILNLNYLGKDVKEYIRKLEEVFINLLREEYDINANRNIGYPGVWIKNDKITAIGCSIRRWVTMHGFAFNVNTNLEDFQWINPCGFKDKGVTSLKKELNSTEDIEKVMNLIIKYFEKVFGIQHEMAEKTVILKEIEGLLNEDDKT